METVNASEVTFCVADDETMWGTHMTFSTLAKVLRHLKTVMDPNVFRVWVVQGERVTHIVPYVTFCEVAGV